MFKTTMIVATLLFSILPIQALASNGPPVNILPVCAAVGPVYLQVSDEVVKGFIGSEWYSFARDGQSIYGQVKGQHVSLIVDEDALTVEGSVHGSTIRWRLSPEHDVIYGLQSCLID